MRIFSTSLGGGGSVSFPIQINQGGTGQTTQTLAFNALSPQTTLGDIIYFDGTNAVRKPYFDETDDGNSSTSKTIDWSGVKLSHKVTLTGNVTFTFTAPDQVGSPLTLRVLTGAGSFTATWPASVKWTGGVAPVVTATASKTDLFVFYWTGSEYLGSYNQNY